MMRAESTCQIILERESARVPLRIVNALDRGGAWRARRPDLPLFHHGRAPVLSHETSKVLRLILK